MPSFWLTLKFDIAAGTAVDFALHNHEPETVQGGGLIRSDRGLSIFGGGFYSMGAIHTHWQSGDSGVAH
jgi:hypothetical protein